MPLDIPDRLFSRAINGPKPAIYHGPQAPLDALRERYPHHHLIDASAHLVGDDWIAAEWGPERTAIRIGRACHGHD